MDIAFLQHERSLDGEADRQSFGVLPCRLVVLNVCFVGFPAVLRRARGGKVPFDRGSAGNEGDVGQVKDAKGEIELGLHNGQ